LFVKLAECAAAHRAKPGWYVLIRHDPENDSERERHCETATNASFPFLIEEGI